MTPEVQALMDDMEAGSMLLRAMGNTTEVVDHAARHAGLLVGVCSACERRGIYTRTETPVCAVEIGQGGLSHGFCLACYRAMRDEIRAYRSAAR